MPKPVRIFDVDFPEIQQIQTRVAPALGPTEVTYNGEALGQQIIDDGNGGGIWYEAIDLSQLTIEGKTFQPLQVILNRPYTVPRGSKFNPNVSVQNEEYFYIFYSDVATPSTDLSAAQLLNSIQAFRRTGMNTSPLVNIPTPYEEEQPNLGQLVWASSSAFLPSLDTALSTFNGLIINTPAVAPNKEIVITNSMRRVDSSEWGSMEPIQGPMLHFYRVVSNYSQNMTGVPPSSDIVINDGYEQATFSPVNIKVVCEELQLSSTEYLSTAYQTLTRRNPAGPN